MNLRLDRLRAHTLRYLSRINRSYNSKAFHETLSSVAVELNKLTTLEQKLSKQNNHSSTTHDFSATNPTNYFSQGGLSKKNGKLNFIGESRRTLEEITELHSMCESDGDSASQEECYQLLQNLVNSFREKSLELALSRFKNYDTCFLEFRAGSGGEDAYDWTSMLVSSYSTWLLVERGFRVNLLESTDVTEIKGGIRQATLNIRGSDSFAWLHAIAGVHRLVRISPFDPQNKRHTSLSQAIVYPEVDGAATNGLLHIKSEDLRIDTFRSSGAGGQHVNTTDSAVRITHIPTGVVVSCQNERSQHSNKATAMTMLRSKLVHLAAERKESARRQAFVGQVTADGGSLSGWGSQSMSLVLNPYQIIKDHRTGWESGKVNEYLAGGRVLSDLAENYLLHTLSEAINSEDDNT